jgi:hypothetical protein
MLYSTDTEHSPAPKPPASKFTQECGHIPQPQPTYIHVPALHAFDAALTDAASKSKPNPTNQSRRLQIKLKCNPSYRYRSRHLLFFLSWG